MESRIGRFAAVDPVRAVVLKENRVNEELLIDPQKLNLYIYGLNNPYKYLDPNGKTVLIQGNWEQTKILLDHYGRLKENSITARLVLRELEQSKAVYTIEMGKETRTAIQR